MVKTSELSIAVRSAIVTLHQDGKKMREIAAKLKVSLKGVYSTIARFKSTGQLSSLERSGRPRATTSAEDQYIVVTSKRNRRLTAPEICAELNKSRAKSVSLTTVNRRLRAAGLKGCVATKKPLLRPQNKKKRLAWAKKHQDWTIEQWNKVLWTDESKFEIFGSKRKVFVRRLPTEKMIPACVVPTVKHGGGSIMVWGSFSGQGVGDLFQVEGILKKEGYHSILQRHAIPSGLRLIGKRFVFQQDNDPKHTSKLCTDYLKKKEKSRVLKIMDWPPQSPDLNPIELLWDELDRQIRKTCPTSRSELWTHLLTAWGNIGQDTIDKLIQRMPRLCAAVKKSKGGYIEENKV